MRSTRRTVIVGAADALDYETTNQLCHLVELLVGRGYSVEVALISDGKHLSRLRRLAKVTVVDDIRRKGLGRVLRLVRSESQADRYTSWRVRRFMDRAAEHTWIMGDPKAAFFLRHADRRPPALVAHLADPGYRGAEVAGADRATQADTDLWLTMTDGQVAEARAAGVVVPVHPVGSLWEPRGDSLLRSCRGLSDPVVMSTPSGAWKAVSHTLEVLVQFRRRAPGVPVIWLTDPGEDEWLARHDLGHVGPSASEQVVVRRRDDTSPIRPRLIIRTGYTASDPDLVLAAAFARVPTVGFEVGDLPSSATIAVTPFAVEELVDRAIELLGEHARERCGAALADAVRQRPEPNRRLAPLYELIDQVGESSSEWAEHL